MQMAVRHIHYGKGNLNAFQIAARMHLQEET